MTATRRSTPTLSLIELLLTGHPGEFMDVPTGGHTVSDRRRLIEAAHRAIGNPSLTDEERARIQAVWLDDDPRYLPPLPLTTQRRDELAGKLVPEPGSRHRMDADELRAGLA